jgi:hypothetical protein
LTESETLWADLLRFRYGHLPTLLLGGVNFMVGFNYSIWWKDITGMIGGADIDWFKSHVKVSVGNGLNTSFWNFKWFGNQPFSVLYPSLYMKEAC